MKLIPILVFFTLINSLLISYSKRINLYLKFILLFSFSIEIAIHYLDYVNKSYAIPLNIYTIITFGLWILILSQVIGKLKKIGVFIFLIYTSIAMLLDFYFGFSNYNFYNWIIGTLFYTILFLYESFIQLKEENFSFFLNRNFILLFSPVLFFMGVSSIFGFQSEKIAHIKIVYLFNLYDLINITVNLIYYGLINIYIYKEHKLQKNAGK